MKIDKFTDEFRFLSTFYPCSVLLDGVVYKTIEHAYQASKTQDKETRKFINSLSAGHARRYGQALTPFQDWDETKVLTDLHKQKMQNPFIQSQFVPLKGHPIIFGNTWHDNELGACACAKCVDIIKENKLGKLLEKLINEHEF